MKDPRALVQRVVGRDASRVPLPGDGRRAAVCAVFTGQDELLFLRRSEYEGDPWSGHVAFPGGRVESGESPFEAAIREANEEVGLNLTDEHLLGELDELRTVGPLPPLVIRPYVFWVEDLGELTLNGEVATTHTLSLRALLGDVGRGSMKHPWRGTDLTFPRVDFDGVRLWGLTLHMVDDLLHRIDGRGRGLARLNIPQETPWDR